VLRIPHCPDNRLTDGGEVVSLTRRPSSTSQKYYFSTSGYYHISAEIAQLVSRRVSGCMAGVRLPAGSRDISLLHSMKTDSGVYPTPYLTGTGGSFLRGIKRQGHEVEHSRLPSAEIKNSGTEQPFHHTSSW
jgi:hypothetical protein